MYGLPPLSLQHLKGLTGEGRGGGGKKLLLIILYLLHPLLNCFLRAGGLAGGGGSQLQHSHPSPFTHPSACLSERRTSNHPLSCLAEKQFFHRFPAWRPDDNARPWNLSMNISAHFLNKSQCFALGDSSAVY